MGVGLCEGEEGRGEKGWGCWCCDEGEALGGVLWLMEVDFSIMAMGTGSVSACLWGAHSLVPLLEGWWGDGTLAALICCIGFGNWYVRHMQCFHMVTGSLISH